MVELSQKTTYALVALAELAERREAGAVSSGQIARARRIPPKFLEQILRELRGAGLVESRRGARGGYLLVPDPAELTVGQVVRLIERPAGPAGRTALRGEEAFEAMWQRVRDAVASVLDTTTFADLVREEREAQGVPNFSI